jgi:hypothetical protein
MTRGGSWAVLGILTLVLLISCSVGEAGRVRLDERVDGQGSASLPQSQRLSGGSTILKAVSPLWTRLVSLKLGSAPNAVAGSRAGSRTAYPSPGEVTKSSGPPIGDKHAVDHLESADLSVRETEGNLPGANRRSPLRVLKQLVTELAGAKVGPPVILSGGSTAVVENAQALEADQSEGFPEPKAATGAANDLLALLPVGAAAEVTDVVDLGTGRVSLVEDTEEAEDDSMEGAAVALLPVDTAEVQPAEEQPFSAQRSSVPESGQRLAAGQPATPCVQLSAGSLAKPESTAQARFSPIMTVWEGLASITGTIIQQAGRLMVASGNPTSTKPQPQAVSTATSTPKYIGPASTEPNPVGDSASRTSVRSRHKPNPAGVDTPAPTVEPAPRAEDTPQAIPSPSSDTYDLWVRRILLESPSAIPAPTIGAG